MTTTMTPASSTTTTTDGGPTERLPDPVPHFIIFHLPHFFGTLIAGAFELIGLESILNSVLPSSSHRYALLGVGLVLLANVNSYLTGSVAVARLEYGVKLPNLYADKQENKHAVLFNCIQRSHQNFMEAFPQIVASAFFTALIAERPNVAGLMLIVISICRYFYAIGYRSNNIQNRFPAFLIAQFAACVGVGYCVWIGITLILPTVGPFGK